MAFQRSARTIRSRLHMHARSPLVIGVTIVAAFVLAVAGLALWQGGSKGFSLEKANASEASSTLASASDDLAVDDAQETEGQAVVAAAGSAVSGVQDGVCVHVSGAVCEPGVYRLTTGSRVDDAVKEAGGFSDDACADAVNLARVVNDGEQIVVPTLEQMEQAGSSGALGASSVSGESFSALTDSDKVNINTADAAELDTLPGIGPATAEKIVADRQSNGLFSTIEDLKRVSGIGDKKYAQLSDLICVG